MTALTMIPGVRRPSPITGLERHRMLVDIACVALAIGRDLYPDASLTDGDIEALDIGAATVENRDVCPRERLAYLSTVWTRVESALRRIEAAPDMSLQPTTRLVSVEKARRATPKDLLFALVRPLPQQSGVRRVAEHMSLPTLDTPANRLIKTILTVFLCDLKETAALASIVGNYGVEREALRLRQRARLALRREPWRTLSILPGNTLPPLPQSVRQNGAYRLLYDIYRRYRQGFSFHWQNALFSLPSRDTWLLYEYWCLFQVANCLRASGFRTSGAEHFALSRSGLTFTLVRGRASTLTFVNGEGRRVALTYNREFPQRNGVHRDGWYSRSHTMRPDIVLETQGQILVLDAKCKTYAEISTFGEEDTVPLTADINQCHAYRDGILHNGQPRVTKAWLLYPGRANGNSAPIISYESEALGLHSEVGAVLLRPNKMATLLPELLVAFLQSCAE